MGLVDLEPLKAADMKLYLAASTVLRVCAVLLPNTPIPRAVIAEAVKRLGMSPRAVVEELVARGLLAEDARTGTVTMGETIVAEVLAGAGDADKLRVRAAVLLEGMWPTWNEMRSLAASLALARELVPHGVHVVDACAAEVEEVLDLAGRCTDTLRCMGSDVEGGRMLRRLVALDTAVYGAEDSRTLEDKMVLGDHLSLQGKLGAAAAELEETLKVMWRVLGNDHELSLDCTTKFARVLLKQRDPRAEEVATRVVANLRRVAGPRSPKTISALETLGLVQREFGKLEEAEATLRSVVEVYTDSLGKEHVGTLSALHNLAVILHTRGQHAEAERVLRRVLAARERLSGKVHPETNQARVMLSSAVMKQGRLDEARAILQRLARVPTEKRGIPDAFIAQQLAIIAHVEKLVDSIQ